ncbi:hypothetical protein [Microbacterium sp. PA5]|uniref:hypothetical protein n=1 Tax=Microbacterium sp. PA5 TaxID=3416654 RepID=UPI003CEE2EA4
MAELLVPADSEVALVDELNSRMPDIFDGLHAGTRIPNPQPAEFIRVTVTGGTERDLVTDTPTLFIEGFATSETRAERITAHAVAALQSAGRTGTLGGITCYGVRVLSLPANLPLPTVPDRFRYRATVSADLRRTAV